MACKSRTTTAPHVIRKGVEEHGSSSLDVSTSRRILTFELYSGDWHTDDVAVGWSSALGG
jgi:hypothetical protein